MNKRGSSLVMTIFLVMLLSVMALSLFTIMVTDKKQVVQQEDKMQSYYLARSGADIVAEFLIDNPSQIITLNGATSDDFNYGPIGDHISLTVAIEEFYPAPWNEPKTISIKSTGFSGERQDYIELWLNRITMDHAIFSEHSIDLENMNVVNGDVGSNENITGDPNVRTGVDYPYMDLEIHTQEFPTSYSMESNINENSDYTFTTQQSDIENIRLNLPSGAITFDTTGGDIDIVVNDFYAKGDIIILGTGRVTLYVETVANFQTPNMTSGDPDQLIIYLDTGAALSLSTPLGFSGRIIGPEATVSLSSNSTLTGSVIANYFYGTSNSNLIYDAPAEGAFVTGYKRDEWK
ncbi:MAG: hypothetical protein JXR88_12760 [Clostridia bacterium]|nr:hypothetical protein [Clostridia bacterium]